MEFLKVPLSVQQLKRKIISKYNFQRFFSYLSLFSFTFLGTNLFVKFIQCAPKIFSNILINYPNHFKSMGLWGKIISIFMAFYDKNLSVISLIQIQIVKSHLFMGLQHKHIVYRWGRELVTVLSNVLTLHQDSFHVLTPLIHEFFEGQDIH